MGEQPMRHHRHTHTHTYNARSVFFGLIAIKKKIKETENRKLLEILRHNKCSLWSNVLNIRSSDKKQKTPRKPKSTCDIRTKETFVCLLCMNNLV